MFVFFFIVLVLKSNELLSSPASIHIPSNPEIVGIKTQRHGYTKAIWESYEDSWNQLYKSGGFTEQSLDNFHHGNRQGIFLIHSLETMMGAATCFEQMWNIHHSDEIRFSTDRTHFCELFKDDFVKYYAEYVLAQRYLIAGSIIAFGTEPKFTLNDTFGSISFIMKVPPQCIVGSAPYDMSTPVDYALPSFNQGELQCKQEGYQSIGRDQSFRHPLYTLGTLLRYPGILSEENFFAGTKDACIMNEVAFLSCAVDNEQKSYKPKIVGIFINHETLQKGDLRNGEMTKIFIDSARTYAETNELPIIENTHISMFELGQRQRAPRIIENLYEMEEDELEVYSLHLDAPEN